METELLRIDEAARVLGLSRSKTYELVAAGAIPLVRIGRAVRVPRRSLVEFIDGLSQEASRVASPEARRVP